MDDDRQTPVNINEKMLSAGKYEQGSINTVCKTWLFVINIRRQAISQLGHRHRFTRLDVHSLYRNQSESTQSSEHGIVSMCRVICTFHYNREYSCEWNCTIFNDDIGSNDDTGTDPAALTNLSWWILWPTEKQEHHRVWSSNSVSHNIQSSVNPIQQPC